MGCRIKSVDSMGMFGDAQNPDGTVLELMASNSCCTSSEGLSELILPSWSASGPFRDGRLSLDVLMTLRRLPPVVNCTESGVHSDLSLLATLSVVRPFDLLHQELSHLNLIVLVCSLQVSFKVVFAWPNLVLLLASRSSATIVELRGFDGQHTVACLLVSCKIVWRREAVVVIASRYITLERTSVC